MPPSLDQSNVVLETGSNGRTSQPRKPGTPAGLLWRTQVTDWPLVLFVPALVAVAVKVSGLPASEPEETATLLTPAVEPKVSRAEASPCALVVVVAGVRLPPPPVTVKVTVVPV